jgi:hypothetical protein
MAGLGQLAQPGLDGLRRRPVVLRHVGRLGRATGVGERPIDEQAQLLEVHLSIVPSRPRPTDQPRAKHWIVAGPPLLTRKSA